MSKRLGPPGPSANMRLARTVPTAPPHTAPVAISPNVMDAIRALRDDGCRLGPIRIGQEPCGLSSGRSLVGFGGPRCHGRSTQYGETADGSRWLTRPRARAAADGAQLRARPANRRGYRHGHPH
jgi:hypothetical protein